MTVTRYIVGYKKEESEHLLKFLFDHIALSQDLQTRIKWAPGTVVVWDVSFLLSLIPSLSLKVWTNSGYRTVLLHIRPCMTGRMARDVILRV